MAEGKRHWIQFPIYVLSDEEGERAIIPNDTQIHRQKQRLAQAEAEVAKRKKNGAPKNEIAVAEQVFSQAEQSLQNMEEIVKNYRDLPGVEVRDYRIARPTFGDYIEAEEQAKDWFDFQPRVNRSKLMIHLMAGNVQLDGNVLGEKEVRAMEPDEAPLIYDEIELRCFPDPSRIPFWNSFSATSTKEHSPTKTGTRKH